MHEEGFSANNVLSYEIVLADGEITTVTEELAGDLFKALKGGTGNFGIVTSFKLQTLPVNDLYAGYLYYAPDQYDALFPIMEAYACEGVESGPKSHMVSVFACNPSLNFDMATFYITYLEPVIAPPPALKPFFDIPSTGNTVKIKTMKEVTDESNEGSPDGLRYNMHTYSIWADAGIFKQLFDIWYSASIGLNSAVPGWSSVIVYQPISNNMIRVSNQRGGNVLGLEPEDDPLIIVGYQFTWERAQDDDKVYATIDKILAASMDTAESQGRLERYIYLNYVGSNQQPIQSYGPTQVDFLCKVKAKYDPNSMFEKLSRGGFKIPS
ncbi:hypothetical protein FRC11_013582 [Ceratobasidium sp. 423]|nr:hypothetical protein FRC11_013582 [Ceratobasidium sp. 423]